jgi:hypothetical protein
MKKVQVYLPKEDLDALRQAAQQSGRGVSVLVREAVRKVVNKRTACGPVAIWDGIPKRTSLHHDSVGGEL